MGDFVIYDPFDYAQDMFINYDPFDFAQDRFIIFFRVIRGLWLILGVLCGLCGLNNSVNRCKSVSNKT